MNSKIQQRLARYKNKAAAVTTGLGLLMVGGVANAALPEAIGTAITASQADALALADLIWPFVIAVFTSLLLFKLFKRYGSKV